jgi:uncharacterized phage protein gp47/JayE
VPDLADFTPLVNETVAAIRARVDADVNAGLSPTDTDYIDTVEGGMFFDLTQVMILEIGRLYDLLATEAVAATFPAFSWGDYLDAHGELVGLERKDATQATGTVTFDAGAPVAGTAIVIAPGVLVATSQHAPDEDPVTFKVTAGGTIAIGQQTIALAVTAEDEGTAGNLAAMQIDDLLSPVDGIASVYNSAATSGGADPESDESFRDRIMLEWRSAGGSGTADDYQRWALAYPGVGHAAVSPLGFGAGTVGVVITDVNNAPFATQTEVNALQTQLDPPQASTTSTGSQTLPVATINVTSTTGFDAAGKVLIKAPSGPQVVSYTGKTGTTLTGCTGGTGSVPAATVVQQGGKGAGLAPIGAVVAVSTPTIKTVAVVATVVPASGYSLDGTSGTIAIRPAVNAAIRDYLGHLAPGDDVIYNHVLARFFAVTGVTDVTGLTLNGSAANVVVAANEVAQDTGLAGIV